MRELGYKELYVILFICRPLSIARFNIADERLNGDQYLLMKSKRKLIIRIFLQSSFDVKFNEIFPKLYSLSSHKVFLLLFYMVSLSAWLDHLMHFQVKKTSRRHWCKSNARVFILYNRHKMLIRTEPWMS